jgi:tRNA pseudouridine38-40 synthase
MAPDDDGEVARSAAGSVRVRLVVSYDGSGFHGFASQPGQRTVSGELARAISNFSRSPVELVCAGRTDSGVHAHGQVVHADLPSSVDIAGLKRAINRQLSPAVVVRSSEPAPEGFDARRSATSRSYRYLILSAADPDPLIAPLVWHVAHKLDLHAMRAAADSLLGEHDFSAFCRRPPGHPAGKPITRRVLDTRWSESPYLGGGVVSVGPERPRASGISQRNRVGQVDGGRDDSGRDDGDVLLRFDVTATSFCHQMVRSVVGSLVEVGRGRMTPSEIRRLLESGDRSGAKTLAPAQGLCLMNVDYPNL